MSHITNAEAFYAVSTARALREVAEDLRSGVLVHNDIHTFADLHDFVDANEYGFLCNEEVLIDFGDDFDGFVTNAVQSTVSSVLAATDPAHGAHFSRRVEALEAAARDLQEVYDRTVNSVDWDDLGTLAQFVTIPEEVEA